MSKSYKNKDISIKEIENANSTRLSVYTIHKYTLTNTPNIFQINQQQQAYETDKYENAHAQTFEIEFSIRRDH